MIASERDQQRRRGPGHLFRRATIAPWRVWLQASASARVLPDFLIIGAQKAGTTSLFAYLLEHPQMVAPFKKEVRFFGQNYGNGINWYRAHFPLKFKMKSGLQTGEASPFMLASPQAPSQLAKWIPQAKLIALLRDPVARAFSHFKMNVRSGRETNNFKQAIAIEDKRIAQGGLDTFGYLTKGKYADHLERWSQHVPRINILVLKSEDLFSNPGSVHAQVLKFLGLPDHKLSTYPAYNLDKKSDPLSASLERKLREYFQPYDQRLVDLLGPHFAWT